MTTPMITFARAVRSAVRLKAAIDGPSGSGKTEGALELATAIVKHYGGKIAVADTEPLGESAGAASLYADRYAFDTLLIPAAVPATLEAVIDAAVGQQYTVLVIDTLSSVWYDLLNRKEQRELNDPKANKWTLWGIYGPEWERLIQKVTKSDIHILATMRSKQTYEQVEDGGKKKIVKMGLQPQVRDGAEYEFSIVLSVNINHRATVSKGRATPWGGDELLDLRDKKVHQQLLAWMDAGGPPPKPQAPTLAPAVKPAKRDEDKKMPGGPFKGTPLGEMSNEDLASELEAARLRGSVPLVEAINTVLENRRLADDASDFPESPLAPELNFVATLLQTLPQGDVEAVAGATAAHVADLPDDGKLGAAKVQLNHIINAPSFPIGALPFFHPIAKRETSVAKVRRAVELAALVTRLEERLAQADAKDFVPEMTRRYSDASFYTTEALTSALQTLDAVLTKKP